MKIILSTKNPSKVEQIKTLFTGLPLSVLSLTEAGIAGEANEDGTTLEENALKKAFFAQAQSLAWSMADDTGFFIDALEGRPGIHAARWAGKDKSTEEIMQYTLDLLKDVPLDKRTATFRTAAAIVSPDGLENHIFIGEVKGRILEEPRTKCQPNMPYSAIFLPDMYDKVWAEMTPEEENEISHRGKAFKQVREFFKKIIEQNS